MGFSQITLFLLYSVIEALLFVAEPFRRNWIFALLAYFAGRFFASTLDRIMCDRVHAEK